MKIKILTVGVPTRDGTIYPRQVIEEALAKSEEVISERGMPVRAGSSNSSRNVMGTVASLALEGDELMAEIDIDLSRTEFTIGGYIAKVRDGDRLVATEG